MTLGAFTMAVVPTVVAAVYVAVWVAKWRDVPGALLPYIAVLLSGIICGVAMALGLPEERALMLFTAGTSSSLVAGIVKGAPDVARLSKLARKPKAARKTPKPGKESGKPPERQP